MPPWAIDLIVHCPFLRVTGWPCPSCGFTRAAAALLRGDLLESLYWNPLLALLLASGVCGLFPAPRRALRRTPIWVPLLLLAGTWGWVLLRSK